MQEQRCLNLIQNTDRLSTVIQDLKKINEDEKKLKADKENLRTELFKFATQDYDDKSYLLPTTTISVPLEFWERTGLTETEFLSSRFPTWDVEEAEYDDLAMRTTFILRKNPFYMPFKFEDDEFKLSKTTTEPTPDIDWITLAAERPDLFDSLAKPVMTYELDGEELERMIAEDPEIISVLTRHTRYNREPQQRVGIKEV